jgi:predicted TPR repeat methyltransferase
MGDLKPFIQYLNSATEINGYFCFSISKNIYNKKDYHLTPSGRFTHSLPYISRQLTHNGFKLIEIKEEILRKEGSKDVPGYIIIARKDLEIVFE